MGGMRRLLCALTFCIPRSITGSGNLMGAGTFLVWICVAFFAWNFWDQPSVLLYQESPISWGQLASSLLIVLLVGWNLGTGWVQCGRPRVYSDKELERDPERGMFRLRFHNKGCGGNPTVFNWGFYDRTKNKIQGAQFPIEVHWSHSQMYLGYREENTVGVMQVQPVTHSAKGLYVPGIGVEFPVGRCDELPDLMFMEIKYKSDSNGTFTTLWFQLRYNPKDELQYETKSIKNPAFET